MFYKITLNYFNFAARMIKVSLEIVKGKNERAKARP